MRRTVIATAVSIAIVGLSAAENAQSAIRTPTNISAQELGSALRALAKERQFHVLFRSELVRDLRTSGAVGELTVDEALTQILSGTALTFRYLDEKTVTIVPERAPASAPAVEATDSSSGTQADNNAVLEEIVVTAQKREERLIDTPQSVSVLSGDTLAKLGATQFRDFASSVPGLSFMSTGAGNTQLTLRGVTAGFDSSPTVGVYVDEVPYGPSGAFGLGARLALDVGLFDVDRIEVLRGPQGTLYGASTMGGLLKYVSTRPNTAGLGIDARTGIAGTRDGDVSYNGAVAVNAPLVADKAAVRVSGFYSRTGGYVDNVSRADDDSDGADIYGGRVDFLLTPSDALSIRIGGFAQDIQRDGEQTTDYALTGAPLDGELEQRRLIAEPFEQRFRLVSGTVTYAWEPATLTSISSYQTARATIAFDRSRFYLPLFQLVFPTRVYSAAGATNFVSTDKFTQEIRLASKGEAPIEWIVGGFYTQEDTDGRDEIVVRDAAGQPAPNDILTGSVFSRLEEHAVFGDLTYHLNSRFDVTGGVRYAENRQRFEQVGSGLALTTPLRRSSEDVLTWLANARYRLNDAATAYVRYATGYRPGGPNFVGVSATTGQLVGPATFEADRLKSYEAGFKAELADRRLGLDVAVYCADWSNIQVAGFRENFGLILNAPGGATVQGAELALTARPTRGFTLTGAFAYQDTQMSEADSDLRAAKGERLPNVPRFTAAIDADYELPAGDWRPTIGATFRRVSDRTASFDASTSYPQYLMPAYTTFDVRTGLALGAVDLQLYVHNVFDERGELAAQTWRNPLVEAQVSILQPRTVGLNLMTRF